MLHASTTTAPEPCCHVRAVMSTHATPQGNLLGVPGRSTYDSGHSQSQVGGGGLSDALQLLTTCVPFWAALAGTALSVTNSALPATLAAVVPPLASAHLPLALLTAGAAVDFTPLQQYQLWDVGLVLGARLLPPLLAGAAAALLAPPAWLPLICVLVLLLTGTAACLHSRVWPSGVLQKACCSVLVELHTCSLLCSLQPTSHRSRIPAGPVADECCQYAHFFRLDERLARSLTHASVLSSALVAAPLAYVAAGASHPAAGNAARRSLSAGMLAGGSMLPPSMAPGWQCSCIGCCQ